MSEQDNDTANHLNQTMRDWRGTASIGADPYVRNTNNDVEKHPDAIMIDTSNEVTFNKSCNDLADALDQWARAIEWPNLTNAEAALADMEDMIDYTSVELADELIYTKKIFKNKDNYVQTQRICRVDGITYFLNITHISSIVELSALLKRSDILTTIAQNVSRPGEFDIAMSYRKISPNRWVIVHKSAYLDIPKEGKTHE